VLRTIPEQGPVEVEDHRLEPRRHPECDQRK
jgi:hypothetical protein